MKYKILKGTKLFDKLVAVQAEINRCTKAALQLMKEVGATHIRKRGLVAAGGISAFGFKDKEKPENWSYAYTRGDSSNDFMPSKNRKCNKELLEKIKELPEVKYEDVNELLNYDYNDSDTRHIYFMPGIVFRDKFILVEIGEQYTSYKKVRDMVEITTSEFNKLKGKKK